MTLNNLKSKGFILTLLASILIVAVSLVAEMKKELFVHETGNLKIFGGLALLLAIGLIFKWRFFRETAIILYVIATISVITFAFRVGNEFVLSYSILILTLISVVILLLTKPVKNYIESSKHN